MPLLLISFSYLLSGRSTSSSAWKTLLRSALEMHFRFLLSPLFSLSLLFKFFVC
jgi:hypothetical protein